MGTILVPHSAHYRGMSPPVQAAAAGGLHPTQQFERRAGGRNIDVEHLCDDARPAVDEVDPTILDAQRLARPRRLRLFEEYEVSAIVEFPRYPFAREDCGVREGRSRAIFAKPGRVHNH